MPNPSKAIAAQYGHRVRLRACGILAEKGQLLMIRHSGLGEGGIFWAPPGGGVEFGERVQDAVTREFLEETGLEVQASRLLFAYQYIHPPLHTIEFFYHVIQKGGHLKKGQDPEQSEQIIEDVRLMDFSQINAISVAQKHGIFRYAKSLIEMMELSGLIEQV